MSNKALISARDLSSGYGKKQILSDVNLDVSANEIVGLLGANGCGKTTLIKTLCKILPGSGEVLIKGEDASSWSARKFAQNCSLVPQKSGISIDITVLDVVLMGFNPFLSLLGRPTRNMVAEAEKLLDLFGIADRKYDSFQTLSEGQKQLVIIARALVTDTSVVFMDEPESSLDFSVRYDMMNTLREQIVGKDKCALVSLHDVNLALNFCDKLLLIKDGKISSVIDVRSEDRSSMEQKLQSIYGSVRLMPVTDEAGKESLIMVKA